MFVSLFKDAMSWFAGLSEATLAIAAVLVVGLVVGMTAFWVLNLIVKKLAGPTAELDSYEAEEDKFEGAEVASVCPDEDSPSSQPPA